VLNAFSKKFENDCRALALYFFWYNWRQHKSLRVAPAMVAGLTDRLWSMRDLAIMVADALPACVGTSTFLHCISQNIERRR
jgi:hypothetical protein